MNKKTTLLKQQYFIEKILLFTTLILLLTIKANAQNTWNGATSTDWATGSNWSNAAKPVSANYEAIVISASAPNNPTYAETSSTNIKSITGAVGHPLTVKTSTINIDGGSTGTTYFKGDINIESGGISFRRSAYLGWADIPSVVNITGGALSSGGTNGRSIYFGKDGQITVNINGPSARIYVNNQTNSYIELGTTDGLGIGIINLLNGTLEAATANTAATGFVIKNTSSKVNIDNGILTMGGDQTSRMTAYVTAGQIVPLNGKTINISYASGLTTVKAVSGDAVPPVITRAGNYIVDVALNGTYVEQGATATDDVDGNITASIVKTGTVDTATEGIYTITYNVTDAAGNAATAVTRKVRVIGSTFNLTAPVITLTGNSTVYTLKGNTYTDAGATATDDVDGNITASIVKTGTVTTSTEGTYTVYYNVYDSNLNAATQVTRTVIVTNTDTWTGATSTDWATGSNWNTDSKPGTSSYHNVTINSSANNPIFSSGQTYVANLTGLSGSPLTIAGGTLYVTGATQGDFNIETGAVFQNRAAGNFGYAGGTTTINVNGGNLSTGSNSANVSFYFGKTGTCTVNINNGGTVAVNQFNTGTSTLKLGDAANGGIGIINLNNGTLTSNLLYKGSTGFVIDNGSVLNIDSGTLTVGGNQTALISNYIANNQIVPATGKKIVMVYDTVADKTTVTAASITTWDGSTWSNGAPDSNTPAVIAGNFTTAGNLTANNITVNSGIVFTVTAGKNVTIQNQLINNGGTITVENNANLIQVNNTTNTGAITVQRNSNALSRLDYTLWSSPVTGTQTLAQFSPLTSQSPSRFYTYTPGTPDVYTVVASPTTTNFTTGTGYLIRMPNTAVAYPATETFAGVFNGVPNNGTVSLTGLTSDKFYAVGNPYPSVVSADLFLNGNSTAGTLYFWRKTNGIANTGSAYATYTLAGGAGTAAPGNAANDILPNGKIQVGQGFIVKTGVAATSLQFTNAMREAAPTSTQFLKIKNTDEKSRIWLNLTSGDVFSQALVAYMDGATEGVDNGIDGKYINDSKIALTSDINGEEYTIQGRPAFDAADVVPLNFKTDKAGEYKIAIDHTDGLFAKGQNVYLVDSVTGTETNLTKEAYTFTAESGATNSRFSLKYESTSKVGSPVFNENTVTVYKNNGTLYVDSAASAIVNIKVFNVQGRLIAELKGVNATTAAIKNLKATQQVLLIQVTSEDKKVVTKKVVN